MRDMLLIVFFTTFIAVPLVGAFFVDIANAVTLQTFVTFLAR